MIFAVSASLPETAWGWVATTGGVVAIILAIGGAIIATARGHINRRVDVKLEEKVSEAVKETVGKCMAPIVEKIDGIRINQYENAESQAKALQRIEGLEVTINNGLTHATQKTSADVDDLKATVAAVQMQVSEMHGWMQATHDKIWDGSDRRTGPNG